MDDVALQRRLDRIERRQSLVLAMLAAGYALAGLWFLVAVVEVVTPWAAAVGSTVALVVAGAAGISRRRANV
ncbi:MAG: hypothetical protein ABEJ40_11525 [Haloarculaceae archaeon]